MIWERFMGSYYSNDDSGFQDIFHIVQNEDEVLAFSLFKKKLPEETL